MTFYNGLFTWIYPLQEKCHQYWPSDRSVRYQCFVVDPIAEYNMPQYILREFKVTDARDGSSRTVRQFQFIDWPEQGVPKSGDGFIDFIGQVHKTKEQFGQDGPITVHCRYVNASFFFFCAFTELLAVTAGHLWLEEMYFFCLIVK
jgi:protein tyrosine phosphatase